MGLLLGLFFRLRQMWDKAYDRDPFVRGRSTLMGAAVGLQVYRVWMGTLR